MYLVFIQCPDTQLQKSLAFLVICHWCVNELNNGSY